MNLDFVFTLVIGAGVLAVIYGTIAKTSWGINLSQVTCPRCQAVQPKSRKPTDAYEVKWGGCTCAQCGTKMDKWGRVRAT